MATAKELTQELELAKATLAAVKDDHEAAVAFAKEARHAVHAAQGNAEAVSRERNRYYNALRELALRDDLNDFQRDVVREALREPSA